MCAAELRRGTGRRGPPPDAPAERRRSRRERRPSSRREPLARGHGPRAAPARQPDRAARMPPLSDAERRRRAAARGRQPHARAPQPTPHPAARPAPRLAAAAWRRRGRTDPATRATPSRGSRRSAAGCTRSRPPDRRARRRAEIHRRDETKPGREERMPADPGDRDNTVLERLAQRLEHGPRELGQLVHQQHAAMGEARLAGPRHCTTAHDRRRRGAVMRRAERRHEDDRPPGRQRAGDGVDAGHLERLVPRERRQDARQPPPEHRLARSRRSREEDVVLSRCRELQCSAPALLAAYLCEVGQERLLELVASRWSGERDVLLAPQIRDRLGQVVHRDRRRYPPVPPRAPTPPRK